MKQKKFLAKPAMLAATLIWGSSFVIVKDTVNVLPVNVLLAIRFSVACVILGFVFFKRLKNITVDILKKGALIGILLSLAYYVQTIGMVYTTPGKNAFLTSVYCVLVPFFAWLFRGARPDKYNIEAAFVCLVGIGFVSLNGDLTMGKGDALTLLSGIFFALHMVFVSKFVNDKDPVLITIVQFAACAVIFWIFSAMQGFEHITLQKSLFLQVGYLSVFCTAVGMLFQNFGQKHTPPSESALILSLESVFGVLFSIALGRENLSAANFIGFTLIFAAILISETKLSFLHKKK